MENGSRLQFRNRGSRRIPLRSAVCLVACPSGLHVLYPDTFLQEAAYRELDRYVTWVEKFHELKCSSRITVIACRDWSDGRRFAGPLLLGQSPAAVTSPTGTAIFLTPYSFGAWDLGGLLRHELSHATLNQNQSLLSVWRMLKQPGMSTLRPSIASSSSSMSNQSNPG